MKSSISSKLKARCQNICELCSNDASTIAYAVSPKNNDEVENEVALCNQCISIIEGAVQKDHWQCLAGSIWNAEQSVQALSYRLLYSLKENDWANEILQTIDLDDAVISWALSSFQKLPIHLDSNGTELQNGDTVILTEGLNVKGANFMAPKGTIIRKIRLIPDNTEQIEGKVNEQTIVILTKFLKKSG